MKDFDFEANAVDFINDHPVIWVGMCSLFGLILSFGCWKIQTKGMAKAVVKELAKNK